MCFWRYCCVISVTAELFRVTYTLKNESRKQTTE